MQVLFEQQVLPYIHDVLLTESTVNGVPLFSEDWPLLGQWKEKKSVFLMPHFENIFCMVCYAEVLKLHSVIVLFLW